jgi:hypothetical protein
VSDKLRSPRERFKTPTRKGGVWGTRFLLHQGDFNLIEDSPPATERFECIYERTSSTHRIALRGPITSRGGNKESLTPPCFSVDYSCLAIPMTPSGDIL